MTTTIFKTTSSVFSTCTFILSLTALTAEANPLEDIASSLKNSSISGSLRYRYEHVDQDNALSNANAGTLKARVTLNGSTVNGFSSIIELDHVAALQEDYNSSANGNLGRSIVADVTGSDINQAYIKYASNIGEFALGKQRINLGTQRYVGGVGWRQNEQTFDALSYNYKSESASFSYSYIDEVHRIFEGDGTSVQIEKFDSNSHLARLTLGNLNAYIYALDFANGIAASNITYGLDYRLTLSEDLNLTGAIAQQSDYGDNPVSYDATYYSLAGKYKTGGATLTAGYEVMGSDDGNANFATPLATLHKWAGWADLFLATGTSNFTDGLEDLYFGVAGTVNKVTLGVTYHDFTGNDSGRSLGSEIDAVATYKVSKNISTQLKYANYSADNFGVDTEKFWLTLTINL